MSRLHHYPHFINGDWCAPTSDNWIEAVNPATGKSWAHIAQGNEKDAQYAVDCANHAFTQGPWSTYTQAQRAEVLISIADVLERQWQQLVEFEINDNGKRIIEVNAQFAGLHLWYRHFAKQLFKVKPQRLENEVPGVSNWAHYEPYGVVAAITPWNSPLMIATWKIAPALAAGNTVVIKPSEHASVSTLKFAQLIATSIMPDGVVNVICGFGHEIGAALIDDARVSKVTFTGSDYGGRSVAENAAKGVKPVTLELGGKSPQLVFADADIDSAVNGVLSGIFLSNGQTCVAGSRLLLDAAIYELFLDKLIQRVSMLKAGDPFDSKTEIAPLANQAHFEKVMSMIATAKEQGAQCIHGGEPIVLTDHPEGYYVAPTLFTQVTPDMALWRDEVFGPVLAIVKFNDEQQAVQMANDTDYGLAAGVWTNDIERAERVGHKIAAGTIYINHYRSVSAGSPVGGYKKSGYGRELGPAAIHDFLQTKSVWQGTQPCADPFPQIDEQ